MVQELFSNFPTWVLIIILIAQIWDLCWKGVGLWKSGRNNHLAWFVAILIFNTVGILPLIYLGWFDKKKIVGKTFKKK